MIRKLLPKTFIEKCSVACVVLILIGSFSAIAQVTGSTEPVTGASVIANPWVQFGALGALVYVLILVLNRQDKRMTERDEQHSKERSLWLEAQKNEADAINNLNATLSELKGKIS